MFRFNSEQVKSLSSFFNTVSAAWFTGGTISPLLSHESSQNGFVFAISGILFALGFLYPSLQLLKNL